MTTPPCTDPTHISEDRPVCPCKSDLLWEDYCAATIAGVCLPCQVGDHRDCQGAAEDCHCATEEHERQRSGA